MLNKLLFGRIDNSSLLIFRMFFGFLVACECFGAIATGWVKRNLITPQYTFPFIDFEWIQPLPGIGMYCYFAVMGCLGVLIAIGYKYRFSCIAFTILWSGAYLMQKTAYNNHYYLLILISFLMCFFPAEKNYSVDVKQHPEIKQNSMYGYVKWVVVLQLFIVYTYASFAKLYGDWLDFGIIKLLMSTKETYFLVGNLLQNTWLHQVIGTMGILFDLLIIPALLWKPSRKIAFVCGVFFHLFNSFIFQIGIFPYLALAFSVFFFDSKTIRKLFFKNRPRGVLNSAPEKAHKKLVIIGFGIYFLVQLLLPIRHYFIKDNVLWTEEGHRMSWRMMLRSRQGVGQFTVVDSIAKTEKIIDLTNYLTEKQQRKVVAYPDFAWQFARYLKRDFSKEGENAISVYLINSKISINGRPYGPFIDATVDLANTPWKPFSHHLWILPSQLHTKL